MSKLLTKQDLVIAENLLEYYKVNLSFHPNLEGGGCHPKNKTIVIGLENDRRTFYSVLCHELGHILAYENKDYLDYHDLNRFKKLSLKRKKIVSWNAERYVDKLGKKIFKKFKLETLGFKYEESYNEEWVKYVLWELIGLTNE